MAKGAPIYNPDVQSDIDMKNHKLLNLDESNLTGLVLSTQIDTDGTLAANSDSKIASQKATKTYSDTKIAATQLDTDGTLAANSDSKIASQKATKTYADTKQAAIGFTPENVANKSTNTSLGSSNTLYPTQNAVKTYADTKQTALGYTAENTANKGAVSGYASLDGSGKVPAAQLPTLSSGTIASTSAVLKGDGAGNAVASTPTGTGDNVLANTPTLITPVLGVATATSINGLSLTASTGTLTVPNGVVSTAPEITSLLGFRHIPQNSKSASYTTVLTDSGKNIYHPVGDNNARTFTIDSNANVAYPIGTGLMFTNMAVAALTVAITSDTLTLLGSGTTGSRTIAQYGRLYVEKDTATSWIGIPIANVT